MRAAPKCRTGDARLTMQRTYQLTADPLYYVMGAFFAVLTTAFPAIMGQPRFLILSQSVVLAVFIAIPLRRGSMRHAAIMLTLWLGVQISLMAALAWLLPARVEHAIPGGFEFRAALLEWLFAAGPLPRQIAPHLPVHLWELAAVSFGSLVSGGLIGVWFIIRTANLAGFVVGSLLPTLGGPLGLLISLPIWSLTRTAGYAGLTLLCAEPLLRGQWNARRFWSLRRNTLLLSVALIILALLLERFVPTLWQQLAATLEPVS